MNNSDHQKDTSTLSSDNLIQDHPATPTTEIKEPRPIGVAVREWLAKFLPPKFGIPSLDMYLYGWKPKANFVIAARPEMDAEGITLTLAEKFASNSGKVIFIGVLDDFYRISKQLLLRESGLEWFDDGEVVFLSEARKLALIRAHERINSLSIDICNIDDCGDEKIEEEFLVSIATDAPTLIIIGVSCFDGKALNPLDILVRRINMFRMVDAIKKTNQNSRVLWQLPVSSDVEKRSDQRPTLSDIDEPTILDKADAVMFAYRDCVYQSESPPNDAELIIVKNNFGSTGTIPMYYEPKFSTWSERPEC